MFKSLLLRRHQTKTARVLSRLMDLGFWPNFLWQYGSADFVLGKLPRWMAESKTALRLYSETAKP